MPVVIDASVAFHWTVRTQYSVAANRLIAATLDFIAPDLIFPEMANAFHRVARVSPDLSPIVADGLQLLPRWFQEIVPSASLRMRALALARSLQHSVYDCFYLALAMERGAYQDLGKPTSPGPVVPIRFKAMKPRNGRNHHRVIPEGGTARSAVAPVRNPFRDVDGFPGTQPMSRNGFRLRPPPLRFASGPE
jgi:predicted nucleic acid-binding protein